MIDTLLSVASNIGAITSLNLCKNRLESLCGLERLLNLQSVDLTHNRIDDPDEIGRLAALPHLRQVYAGTGNNLSSRANWRVRLFAAFAIEDNISIQIDGSQPSWSESRQIASEVARRPAHRRRADRTVSEPARPVRRVDLQPPERPTSPDSSDALSPSSAAGPKKQRRKKPKRIVDLGNGHPAPSTSYFTEIQSPRSETPDVKVEEPIEEEPPKRHQRSITETPSTSSMRLANGNRTETLGRHSIRTKKRSALIPGASAQAQDQQPDDFRKRMEALRSEVGDDWLRVWSAQAEQQTAGAS
jgi:hypothetical protein